MDDVDERGFQVDRPESQARPDLLCSEHGILKPDEELIVLEERHVTWVTQTPIFDPSDFVPRGRNPSEIAIRAGKWLTAFLRHRGAMRRDGTRYGGYGFPCDNGGWFLLQDLLGLPRQCIPKNVLPPGVAWSFQYV